MKNAHKILIGNLKGRDHLERLGVDARILELILIEYVVNISTGIGWFKTILTSGGLS
jgi:hypothetical protein